MNQQKMKKRRNRGARFYYIKNSLIKKQKSIDVNILTCYYRVKEVVTLKSLTVRVDDELHKQLKYKMIEEETTIQDYVMKLIKKDLEKSEKEKKK